jgi:hypothetical protein
MWWNTRRRTAGGPVSIASRNVKQNRSAGKRANHLPLPKGGASAAPYK